DAGAAPRAAPSAKSATPGMVADLSHEIRTPLNTVAAAAHLLLDSPLDAGQRDLVDAVRRGCESLRAIVDDLVDAASLESGALRLEEALFAPAALVDECLAAVRPEAAERRVRLAAHVDPATPTPLLADAARLRRMIVRHVTSAVRSATSGMVVVAVTSRP